MIGSVIYLLFVVPPLRGGGVNNYLRISRRCIIVPLVGVGVVGIGVFATIFATIFTTYVLVVVFGSGVGVVVIFLVVIVRTVFCGYGNVVVDADNKVFSLKFCFVEELTF